MKDIQIFRGIVRPFLFSIPLCNKLVNTVPDCCCSVQHVVNLHWCLLLETIKSLTNPSATFVVGLTIVGLIEDDNKSDNS